MLLIAFDAHCLVPKVTKAHPERTKGKKEIQFIICESIMHQTKLSKVQFREKIVKYRISMT